MAAADDTLLMYYPPWGDCRLGRVNDEDLEFTLSNLRDDPSRTGYHRIGEVEVTVMELWYDFRNGDTTWGEFETNMDCHQANQWRCEECE